jgi:hypothetical protein
VSCNTSEPTGTPSDPGAYITLVGICQITQTGKFLCRTFCGCPNVKPHGGAVNRDNSVVLTRYSHLKFVSLRSRFSVGTGQRSPLLMQFCLSTKSLTRCRPELGDQADDSPAVHTRWRCTVLTFRVRSGFRACVPAYERRQHSRADNPSAAWVAIEYSSALVLFAAARVRGCEPDYDDTTTSASPVIRLSTLGTPGNRHPARTVCFVTILSALKIARFPAATGVPSRLSLHPRAPRISPGGMPRGIPVYIGWRNPDVFAIRYR